MLNWTVDFFVCLFQCFKPLYYNYVHFSIQLHLWFCLAVAFLLHSMFSLLCHRQEAIPSKRKSGGCKRRIPDDSSNSGKPTHSKRENEYHARTTHTNRLVLNCYVRAIWENLWHSVIFSYFNFSLRWGWNLQVDQTCCTFHKQTACLQRENTHLT